MHLYRRYLKKICLCVLTFLGENVSSHFASQQESPGSMFSQTWHFPGSQNLKFPNKCPMTGTNLQACKFNNRKLIRHTCFRSLSFLFLFALAAYHMPISFPDNPDGCLPFPRLLPLPFENSALLRTPLQNMFTNTIVK